MRYGSVCSGIEAATVAWHPLGWVPAWFSEIADFPSRVLAHRWPTVENRGDFTAIRGDDEPALDLLVGGTPCQSFSVAGLRGGLADDRGNLALEFLSLASRTRARWVVWENVPGVLSSDGGRAFGSILGGLAELGYGFAYRVLDAQFFGVPQRRRRVFIVGYLGDWRRAAAVLFERASLSWDPAPRRKTRQDVAGTLGGGSGKRGWCDNLDRAGAFIPESFGFDPTGSDMALGDGLTSPKLRAGCAGSAGHHQGVAFRMRAFGDYAPDGLASTVKARNARDATDLIAHSLRGEGFDASEDGTGRGTPLVPAFALQGGGSTSQGSQGSGWNEGICFTLNVTDRHAVTVPHGGCFDAPIAFDTTQITHPENRSRCDPGAPCHSLAKGAHPPAIAFQGGSQQDQIVTDDAVVPALTHASNSHGGHYQPKLMSGMSVRRLTPRECERLQGFPDDYTAIPGAKDGPRYRALGNTMAVKVMRWIGERIALVDAMPFSEVA